jgi:hypothetical protein
VFVGLSGAGVRVVFSRHEIRRQVSRPGRGADRAPVLYAVCLFVRAAAVEQPVISYTNLFRNRETAFLLTLPVSTQTIFRWKFIESIMLASWAFLFLIAPLLVAFGLVRGVPWHFYPLTVLLIGLFIILPGVLGSALAIGIGRHLDRRSFKWCCFCWRCAAARLRGLLVEGQSGG